MFLKVAILSLLHRKYSVLLTVLSMLLSVLVLLGVEHIRTDTKRNFTRTVSGVDLIVGARGGEINLLLYSVFHSGSATNNVSWDSYQKISNMPNVAWSVPISLGDSHQGHKVVGTVGEFFSRVKYADNQSLKFAKGGEFKQVYDVVLGASVAAKLNYKLGDKIVLAHGIAKQSFTKHDDFPFTIVGILEPTSTPIDYSLYVSLDGIEAIHQGWVNGVQVGKIKPDLDNLTPSSITAFMLGLEHRVGVFNLQRQINNYRREPLMAILPQLTLSKLWQSIGMLEQALNAIAYLVLLAALLGLGAMLLASIKERAAELQILRIMGARPKFIFGLIIAEAVLISQTAIVFALFILLLAIAVVNSFYSASLGMYFSYNILGKNALIALAIISAGAVLVSIFPAINAYRATQNINYD